ncbi:Ada metal-binding domain-containing protein [Fructobacillus tropaeoli]|uniref:Ada regulatory protein n=1 Tax=Fructobacillus tropaeoli TaxID=709323 RepID=A0A3F3HCX3_9LACO|nr:Ada metal-binding domain-containing protein [Fructobacillus tropaeoli]NLS37730.1 helix-turn-helix domain-containing protein [Fructobacillus tropaeoli]CAK1223217.1 Methylphosphotriester-DNA--protein-cysteine methyltransferase (N-terminal fragment of Ada) [Fructobacillus tropaeoli]CAK1232586.1 Methylphosphotriester-DNA--protein-cysteine methyltransferase (N-terminal fragment of Ada) [Fructobacillus tropaeoli]CAK1237442.1 Methylphosphotriester-DNA--protein-cysteine methyltransferase (N-terminal
MYSLTKKRWQAIHNRDADYNGSFIYGVTTDKRVCCPSCVHGSDTHPEDIQIFKTNDEALFEGFRPCSDCQPFGELSDKADLVFRVKEYLSANYKNRITLESLSEDFSVSSGILHRAFMTVAEESPQSYLLRVRMFHAKKLLKDGKDSVALVGLKVGIPNLSYFNTVFKQEAGVTAVQYRKQNK